MTRSLMTCRFCGESGYDDDAFVKYGVRHHAHNTCFLALPDLAERIKTLPLWPLKQLLNNTNAEDWPVGVYCQAEQTARREY